jgi:hypothetical protein
MSDATTKSRPAPAYDRDYHAWTLDQAERLRDLQPNSIDWENVAEEIESLGGSQRREIRSRLVVALTHLLKWAYQPAGRNNSWRASIAGARAEIRDELAESPSLKRYPAQVLAQQYVIARLKASGETDLVLDAFPESCPFTIEQVLDPDFWPDAPQT